MCFYSTSKIWYGSRIIFVFRLFLAFYRWKDLFALSRGGEGKFSLLADLFFAWIFGTSSGKDFFPPSKEGTGWREVKSQGITFTLPKQMVCELKDPVYTSSTHPPCQKDNGIFINSLRRDPKIPRAQRSRLNFPSPS